MVRGLNEEDLEKVAWKIYTLDSKYQKSEKSLKESFRNLKGGLLLIGGGVFSKGLEMCCEGDGYEFVTRFFNEMSIVGLAIGGLLTSVGLIEGVESYFKSKRFQEKIIKASEEYKFLEDWLKVSRNKDVKMDYCFRKRSGVFRY